ncbi:MAG: TIR domain-containing protein [Candidatus Electrothrix gigas]
MKPRMFIGSSVEGKDIAEYIQLGLEYDVETTIWHQGIFGLSDGSLESLVRAAKDFDFAALVLTPDDLIMKRGTEKGCPRDNVVFELGLFMGALGRERTFIVYNRDKQLDLPTDLAGVTPATFASRSDDNLHAALGPVCTRIKQAINTCGLKAAHSAEPKLLGKAEPKPVPVARNKQSTVIVDQNSRGDYATITEALESVKAGTCILVRPGLYKESIVIDKPVEIIGDGDRDDIVIESFGKSAVLFEAKTGKLVNLTLRQAGSKGWHGGYGVDIAQGKLIMENCDISSQSKSCVVIHSFADLSLRRCRIHDGKENGIYFYENGQGTLEDNDIFANTLAGIDIASGHPTLRRNRITKNDDVGVKVRRCKLNLNWRGGGIFEDNDLRDNAGGAWEIEPCCELEVQRRDNKE